MGRLTKEVADLRQETRKMVDLEKQLEDLKIRLDASATSTRDGQDAMPPPANPTTPGFDQGFFQQLVAMAAKAATDAVMDHFERKEKRSDLIWSVSIGSRTAI